MRQRQRPFLAELLRDCGVTREERRAYIRRIVDAAPPLSAEDATALRSLLPLAQRAAVAERPAARRPQVARTAAA